MSQHVNAYFFNFQSVFGHHVARKFYVVTVFPVFLPTSYPGYYLRSWVALYHLNDKTHSHRNSFHLNPFSQAVASEIVIDQLQITNCKKISFRTMVQDIVKYRQLL